MRFRLSRNPRFLLLLAVVALILPGPVTRATTRIVNNLGDSGAGTLRDTLAAFEDGGTINSLLGQRVVFELSQEPIRFLTVAQHAADGTGESTIRIFKSTYWP